MSNIKSIGSVLLMIALAWACSQDIEVDPASESKEPSMTIENRATQYEPAIPPIDAMAPEKFETATFGLG